MENRRIYQNIITKDQARAHYGDCYNIQGPVTVFTTAASATNLLESLGRTLDNIYGTRHLTDLDFILPNIVSQLTVWRIALAKIQEWAEIGSEVEGDHYDVLDPLSAILSNCHILASKVDDGIQDMQTLSIAAGPSKENEDIQKAVAQMGELQTFIERQTSTLNLLLTACNTKALDQQKRLLGSLELRSLMLNVKNDAESLVEHRDSSSFRSLSTDRGSTLSIVFDFDKFLWTTEVYASNLRKLVKKQVRNPPQDSTLPDETSHENSSGDVSRESQRVVIRPSSSAESDKRSWTERWQKATGDFDKIRARPKGTLLLLGASSSDSAVLMTLLSISCQEGPNLDQLGRYQSAIYKTVIDDVKLLLENLRGLHLEHVADLDADIVQTILQYDTSAPVPYMNKHFLATLTTLWGLPGFLTALEQSNAAFPENAVYLLKDFERMTSPGYSPTEADVLKVLKHVDSPNELRHRTRACDYHFFNFSGELGGTTGWSNTSSSLSSIIYCVNLAEYDKTGLKTEKTGLVASLDFFEASMRTGLWVKPVILLLTHMDEFRQKLARSPLKRLFPDYSGGDDVGVAAKYILGKFLAVRHSVPIYVRTFDLTSTTDVWKIYDVHHTATKTTLWEGLLRGLAY